MCFPKRMGHNVWVFSFSVGAIYCLRHHIKSTHLIKTRGTQTQFYVDVMIARAQYFEIEREELRLHLCKSKPISRVSMNLKVDIQESAKTI